MRGIIRLTWTAAGRLPNHCDAVSPCGIVKISDNGNSCFYDRLTATHREVRVSIPWSYVNILRTYATIKGHQHIVPVSIAMLPQYHCHREWHWVVEYSAQNAIMLQVTAVAEGSQLEPQSEEKKELRGACSAVASTYAEMQRQNSTCSHRWPGTAS